MRNEKTISLLWKWKHLWCGLFLVGAVVGEVMFQDAVVLEPAMLEDGLLKAMVVLLGAGGEVQTEGLDQRLRETRLIVTRRSGGQLVGLAAIKRPARHYRDGVFRRAGLPNAPTSVVAELGYVVVDERFRGNGIGPDLIAIAAQQVADPLFATSRSRTMQAALLALGFSHVGSPYTTDPNKKQLKLYIRGGV